MRTITLKTDDRFFEKVNTLAKHLHLTKSELIRRAVAEYESMIEKKILKEQMKAASLRVRESNKEVTKVFESILKDGLQDV